MTDQQQVIFSGDRHAPLWWRLLLPVLKRARYGVLRVGLPDQSVHEIHGEQAGPAAAIQIHRSRLVRRFLAGGDTGLLESYMDGDWDSPDLAALLEWGAVNERDFGGVLNGNAGFRLLGRLLHRFRRNSRRGSQRNIAYHYDVGNDFYALWLDPELAYSSGIYESPADDLARAQQHKFRRMAELLELRPEHHLLEIGSGWGGFAIYAARHSGCRVTGITVSREQLRVAQERARQAGVAGRVTFRFEDYRDVRGTYDRVASIEMFEAVGEQYWPRFFRMLHDRLVPGGRAALQVITIDDELFPVYRRDSDFIQRYVFPGGMLPSPAVFARHVAQAGLRMQLSRFFGQHYACTLAAWDDRFVAAAQRLRELGYSESFLRMWRCYLAYCQAGFRIGRIDLLQALLIRGETHG